MQRILSVFLFLTCGVALGQRVENVKAEVLSDGDRVIITYDLTSANASQRFKVSLYSSHNNYASPLTLVTGDVGRDRELAAGTGKRIEWSAKSELREYSGDITFEVRAELVSSLFIQSPSLGARFKRGKVLEVTWQGGTPGESMRLDLMKGGAVISQMASIQNNQRYTWSIPKSMDKSKDYQVRLTADSGTALSGTFSIKSKTPFLLKALPFLAAGGAAAAFLGGGGTTKGTSNLPEPPQPN